MGLFNSFMAGVCDSAASTARSMSHDSRLTPEQRERIRAKADEFAARGNMFRESDEF